MSLAFGFPPKVETEFDADVFLVRGPRARAWAAIQDSGRRCDRHRGRGPGGVGGLARREREALVRSKVVTGFPYRVIYFVQDNRLTIVAVAHSKRRPGYWRERVSE